MVVYVICELGGIEFGEKLWMFLFNELMYFEIEILLMFVVCCEYLVCFIELVLVCGEWVICDWFSDVIYVY